MYEEKIDIKLVKNALVLLYERDYSIPELSQELCVNEIDMIKVIGFLEKNNQITLKSFKKILVESEGFIYLALYGIY